MALIIASITLVLLWNTALSPMLAAADECEEREFQAAFRRFQLRSIKKYHQQFLDNPELHELSLDDIEKHFRVQSRYDEIGRS